MGLDMYLTAEQYIPMDDRDDYAYDFDFPVSRVVYEVCYWRKVNSIHKWFVDNVQEGQDDCQKYEVSAKQLQTLLATVKAVLADPSKAAELLPPHAGFFFGSTAIDDIYMDDLRYTAKALEKIPLAMLAKTALYYQSSW